MKLSEFFFEYFALASGKSRSRENTPYFWEALNDFEEIKLTATMDMSASWKGLRKGGACKQRLFLPLLSIGIRQCASPQ
jgi:hypothetical protein